jgi:histidine triad (HIT) family protein
MDDCIFCKIIQGKIPCYKVYEDENYLAFLDVMPISKGHTLVLPKKHYANIYEIPEDVLCGLMAVVKKVSVNIKEKFEPEALFLNQNNGEKAGQSVMHFHMHIKPVYEDTKLPNESAENRNVLNTGQMEEYARILKID